MQLPKSKAEKYNCQDNDDWAVRFESSQVTDPSATNAQAQEQKRPNATDRRANSSQDAASKSISCSPTMAFRVRPSDSTVNSVP